MTVCVAAIADGGKRVILAADNMITAVVGNIIQYQREDKEHKKIYELTPNVFALFSGVIDFQEPILRLILGKIRPDAGPFEVANITRSAVQEFYLRKCEEEILMRFNLTWDVFTNKQQQLNQELVKELTQKINSFTPDILIIIAGLDEKSGQPFLGLAGGIGFLTEKTLDGFVTTGSGGEMAKFSLLLHDYSTSLTPDRAETLVKQAVIDAKKCPGIGDLGDIFVIPKPPVPVGPESPKHDL